MGKVYQHKFSRLKHDALELIQASQTPLTKNMSEKDSAKLLNRHYNKLYERNIRDMYEESI